jgi:ubiquinone/menaquinone biosynthesis C-methylase UbiE
MRLHVCLGTDELPTRLDRCALPVDDLSAMHPSKKVLHSAASWKFPIALASLAALVVGASAQQNELEREKVERVADILLALGSRDGAHIADLGSADGFYTLRIAKAVAPNGRAYAIDIDQKSLDKLRDRAEKETVGNIQIILGEAADSKLPEATLDAVLIRNAYHEMPEYRSVLKGVMSGLKPGGLLIVIEAMHAKYLSLTRELQVKEHEIAPGIVEAELREAGFEIVERDDSFTTFTRDPTGGFWLIKARRKLAQ